MNKNIALVAFFFLLIGFGLGFFVYKNHNSVSKNIGAEETTKPAKIDNEFFSFLNSFSNTPGYSNIIEIREDLGLLTFVYPKTIVRDGDGGVDTYGIYDYKNDVLYKNIGYSQLSGSSTPVALIRNDLVLVKTADNEGLHTTVSIKDFHDKTIHELSLNLAALDTVEIGGLDNGSIGIFVHSKKKTLYYTLNAETLQLTKVWER